MKRTLYCRYRLTPKLMFALFMALFAIGHAQSTESLFSFTWKQEAIGDVFEQIEQRADVRFSYNPLELDVNKRITLQVRNAKLDELLDKLGQQLAFRYRLRGEMVIIQFNEQSGTVLQQFINGQVQDSRGQPLEGVTIVNMRTNSSQMSTANGNFSIPAQAGDELRFRMMGYTTETVTIAAIAQPLRVVLEDAMVELDETVVTALGITREERSLGYAVSEVAGAELKKVREPNVINSLAGRVAGLVINSTAGGPAGSSRVIIRGATTITGNNQPLYVVDGIPMDNSNYGQVDGGKFAAGYDLGDAISALNPDDIAKVSVLKGPSASALYGSRAANGVILITTKRGGTNKELGIELNSTMTFENQLTTFDGYQTQYGQGRNQNLVMDADQARTSLFSNFGPRLDPD